MGTFSFTFFFFFLEIPIPGGQLFFPRIQGRSGRRQQVGREAPDQLPAQVSTTKATAFNQHQVATEPKQIHNKHNRLKYKRQFFNDQILIDGMQ